MRGRLVEAARGWQRTRGGQRAWLAATGSQLRFLAVWDRATPHRVRADERAEVAERVTMAVKTFERPSIIDRFVRSARRVFDGRIVVADDSQTPWTSADPGVDVLPLPFNSGVSVGRNAAVDAVTTEFVFVADDDLVFTAASNLGHAVRYLDAHPEVDIIGFVRIELPRWYFLSHGTLGLLAAPRRPARRPLGEDIDGARVAFKIEQAYLARTPAIQRIRWDEQLRMVDHADFFTRAYGELLIVLDERVRVYHARTPHDPHYVAYREDVSDDLRYLQRKWANAPQD